MVTCRVDTVCIIDSLFCGKIIFARLLEGEAVVIDDALVLNSYFFSRSVNNGDMELWLNSARELRKVHEGVKVLIGNFFGVLVLVVSLPSLKV